MRSTPDQLGQIPIMLFIGTWIVLGAAGFVIFYLGDDVAFKRGWFPRFVILTGALFSLFTLSIVSLQSGLATGLGMQVVILPAVALISWMNIRLTKFCGGCGSTIYNGNWFAPHLFCSRCGADLDAKPKSRDDWSE